MRSGLYDGEVIHVRRRPVRHRLRYRLSYLLLDLDEAAELGRRLRLFGCDRPGLYSFRARDHGEGSGDLRAWVVGRLAQAGAPGPWGRIGVLCLPRLMGYVFNPLSVYFCEDPQGRLGGVVYEVNNTFGERHAYALGVETPAGRVDQACRKTFYVSPFMPMELGYRFRISPPGEAVAVEIAAFDEAGPLLEARFAGRRRELSDAALAMRFVALPFMTLKVILAIHLEALRLWMRGAPFFARPRPAHPTPPTRAPQP